MFTRRWMLACPALVLTVVVASCKDPVGTAVGSVAQLNIVGGDLQHGEVGAQLSSPLVVEARNAQGQLLPGQLVNFIVVSGGGTVFAGAAQTNGQGIAQERWTLGPAAGDTQRVEARAVNTETGAPMVFAVFKAIGDPGPVASVSASAPNLQFSSTGDTTRLQVAITDRFGNTVAAAPAWSSTNPAVATVSAGLVTAVAQGSASVIVAVAGRADTVPINVTPQVDAITIAPSSALLNFLGDAETFSATARDRAGVPVPGMSVTWQSTTPAIVEVSSSGVVTAKGRGNGQITATAGGKTAAVAVVVRQVPVAVSLTAPVPRLLAGETATVSVAATDSSGAAIPASEFTWSSSNTGVVSVNTVGVVTAVSAGSGVVIATSHGVSGSMPVDVRGNVTFSRVFIGEYHTCGLTSEGYAYCWGPNFTGTLGDGTTVTRTAPATVGTAVRFSTLALGGGFTCGLAIGGSDEGRLFCWGRNVSGVDSRVPVAKSDGVRLVSLVAGSAHACGLTSAGAAYCFGEGREGQLGTGASGNASSRAELTQAAGGHTFALLAAGGLGTCGATSDAKLYCWGQAKFYAHSLAGGAGVFQCNVSGPVDGPPMTCSATPVLRDITVPLTALAIGGTSACGLSSTGVIHCWGWNLHGQLGVASVADRPEPRRCQAFAGGYDTDCSPYAGPVQGGLTFTAVAQGSLTACGIATDGGIYCWGDNTYGQLGNGSTGVRSSSPVRVSSSQTFTSIAMGEEYVCAVATTGTTYCWGANNSGQLGDGTTTNRAVPTRVLRQP